MGTAEKIREIQEQLNRMQYNKATEKYFGELKGKLAHLKAEAEKSGGSGAGLGYAVRKAGDATVVLVGFPSVGKSTLLNKLTAADSKVAAYDFTTLDVIPGMLSLNGARIQVLDVPGLIEQAASGKGRGKQVLSAVRNADAILLLVSGQTKDEILRQRDAMLRELHEANIRVNEQPADLTMARKERGGLLVQTVGRQAVSRETVKEVVRQFGYVNAEIVIREPVTVDRLVDALAGNRIYVKAVVAVSKSDAIPRDILAQLPRDWVRISAEQEQNLDGLKAAVWQALGLTRIYLKRTGRSADLEAPLIIKGQVTVETVAKRLHKEFLKRFRFARVWGPSAKYDGCKVGIEHPLRDGDVLEIHSG